MLKRCLLAVIVALLVTMTSSQIAAAEDYDWSQAPRIGTKIEFTRYIENERRNRDANKHRQIFHVVLINGLKVDTAEDFVNLVTVPVVSINGIRSTDGTAKLTYNIVEYPGTRVANAYLSSNQQQACMNLNHDEQYLFNIAVGIVDEANKLSSEREKAEYIHNEICRHVKEPRSENERYKTATGALIDGYAQCQGFTDAFYMLGRMAGLKVGRITGTTNNGTTGHAWNWITFSDGKSYCIDVTNGFNSKSLYLFCATKECMEKTHSCDWEIIPNLQ